MSHSIVESYQNRRNHVLALGELAQGLIDTRTAEVASIAAALNDNNPPRESAAGLELVEKSNALCDKIAFARKVAVAAEKYGPLTFVAESFRLVKNIDKL